MKNIIVWIVKFVYRVSGLQMVVDWVDNRVFIYRKRLQMVPFTFKVFVWTLGVASGVSGYHFYTEYPKLAAGEQEWTFEQPLKVEVAHATIQEPVVEEEWLKAEFSAYTASVGETDASPLIMASGKMVYVGAMACPRSMEFGTSIEVRGIGVFTCEDRMNIRYTNNFDLFKLTKQEAKAFGRKTLEYKIVK